MQLIVIAATMPSLLLLSRTRLYPSVRTVGALFAATASIGWIAERCFRLSNPLDQVVEALAQRAIFLAIGLFLLSALVWWLERGQPRVITSLIPRAIRRCSHDII